jgi:hypothetical protein
MSGHLDRVTLEEAMARTQAVVVARPLEPEIRRIEIPLAPDGAHPPFGRIRHRFRVAEVLKGKLAAGEEIEVDNPSWGYDLIVHKKRYLEGVNKITIHESYESSITSEELRADPRRILLLNKTDEGWEFTCPGSSESLRRLPDVRRLMHK